MSHRKIEMTSVFLELFLQKRIILNSFLEIFRREAPKKIGKNSLFLEKKNGREAAEKMSYFLELFFQKIIKTEFFEEKSARSAENF